MAGGVLTRCACQIQSREGWLTSLRIMDATDINDRRHHTFAFGKCAGGKKTVDYGDDSGEASEDAHSNANGIGTNAVEGVRVRTEYCKKSGSVDEDRIYYSKHSKDAQAVHRVLSSPKIKCRARISCNYKARSDRKIG